MREKGRGGQWAAGVVEIREFPPTMNHQSGRKREGYWGPPFDCDFFKNRPLPSLSGILRDLGFAGVFPLSLAF